MGKFSHLFQLDQLAMVMLVMVGFIGLCVGIFSRRYLKGDTKYRDFFGTLCLLTTSVFMMVFADHILLLWLIWGMSNMLLVKLIKVTKANQVLFLIFRAFGMLFFSHAAQLAESSEEHATQLAGDPKSLRGFKSENYKFEGGSKKVISFCEVRSESHLDTSGLKNPEKKDVPLSAFLKNRIVSKVSSRFSKDISSHYENGILFRSKDSQFRSFYSSLEAYIQELGSSNFDKLTAEDEVSICSSIQLIIEETEDFCKRHTTFYNLIPENFRKGKIEKCKIEVFIEKGTSSNVKTLSIDLVKATSKSINCLQEFFLQHNDLLLLICNRVKSQYEVYDVQSKLLGVKKI